MDKKKLEQLGLTRNESIAYLALLESGPTSILELSRKTDVNRSMLYDILHQLAKKGLAKRAVRGKKIRFSAESPEKLQSLLVKKFDLLKHILPDLNALDKKNDVKPSVVLYEGLEGIKDVYRGAYFSRKKKLHAFVGAEHLLSRTKALEEFWEEEFKRERRNRAIFGYVIVPDNPAGRSFKQKDNKNFRESRCVNADAYNFMCEIMFYDDIVAFICYTEFEEHAISIKSAAITETIKMLWESLWGISQ